MSMTRCRTMLYYYYYYYYYHHHWTGSRRAVPTHLWRRRLDGVFFFRGTGCPTIAADARSTSLRTWRHVYRSYSIFATVAAATVTAATVAAAAIVRCSDRRTFDEQWYNDNSNDIFINFMGESLASPPPLPRNGNRRGFYAVRRHEIIS